MKEEVDLRGQIRELVLSEVQAGRMFRLSDEEVADNIVDVFMKVLKAYDKRRNEPIH